MKIGGYFFFLFILNHMSPCPRKNSKMPKIRTTLVATCVLCLLCVSSATTISTPRRIYNLACRALAIQQLPKLRASNLTCTNRKIAILQHSQSSLQNNLTLQEELHRNTDKGMKTTLNRQELEKRKILIKYY